MGAQFMKKSEKAEQRGGWRGENGGRESDKIKLERK